MGYRWSIFLSLTLALSIAFRDDLLPLRDTGARLLLREELNDFGQHLAHTGRIAGDVRFSFSGLMLGPGESVAVEWPFANGASNDRLLGVAVWLNKARGLSNVVECKADGRPFVEIARDVFGSGAMVPLTPCRGGRGQAVRIRVSRSELGPVQRVFALDRVELLELSRAAPSAPRLTPLVTGAVLLAIIVFGPALAFPPSIVALLGFCAAAILAALHIWIPGSFALHTTLRYLSDVNIAAILLLIVLFAAAGAPRAWPERRLEILAVALFLGIGFNARWEAVSARLAVALSSDARFVQAIAAAMTHPYDTAVREPLWLWGVRLAMLPFGDSPLAALMFTFCCAMLLLAATFWFVRRYFTPAHALGVLALLAVHSALIESAAAAHRTELYAVLLVGVACFAFLPDLSPRGRTFGLATTISLTVLAQTAGFIPAVGGALASQRVRRSVSWVGAVVIGVVLVALILPHAVYTAHKYGQAFYFSRTLVPTFYRNYEFMNVKRTGCDGCPSPQEMAGNSYSGRPASMAEYLFKLHTVQEVLSGLVAGYARTFVVRGGILAYLLGSGSLLGYILYVTGMFSLLATRARELLVIPLLSVNLLAFLIPIGIDLRLLLHLAPFMAIAIVCGVAVFVSIASRWVRMLAPQLQMG